MDYLTWPAIIMSLSGLMAVVGFLYVRAGNEQKALLEAEQARADVKTLKDELKEVRADASAAKVIAAGATGKYEIVMRDMSDLQVKFATDYVRHQDVALIRGDIKDLRGLVERLLEKVAAKT